MNKTIITVISSCVYGKVVCAILRAFNIDYRVCSVNTKKISDIYYAQEDYNFNVNFMSHDDDYFINLSKHIGIPLKFMKDVKSVNLDFVQEEYSGLIGIFSTQQGHIIKTKDDWWISDYVFTDLTFEFYNRDNISQICYKITKGNQEFPGFSEIEKIKINNINIDKDLIKSEFYLSDIPRRFIINNIYVINPHHLPVYKDPFHTISCTIFAFIGMINNKNNKFKIK